ncbi:MAG: 3-phosphoserine/phosphohydroxythreonine transaminase [Deltaproteobacteria bacterium]|nr:3-phosphoserine/phosphohydroxythreonine transaminase [Deltaproteobacteria bacterium]
MARTMNFNAGPAALPLPALERAREEFLDFSGSGMSVMEHSHRGKEYDAVHEEALAQLKALLGVPHSHAILFLQGGASQLFAQVPMNFLPAGQSADYVVNGVWGEKAIGEARAIQSLGGGTARLAGSSGVGDGKEKQYTRVVRQDELQLDGKAAYLHFTSNETIHGNQYAVVPERPFPVGPSPLVCDMSSDFLWKPTDVSKFALIYAGAQKNIGPSGVVVVIAAKEFIERGRKDIPKIFQLRTVLENNSLYNTPPTFGIYMIRNVLAWAQKLGGLPAIEKLNREKAAAIYGAIDGSNGFFNCPVEKESRSVMNVVFRLPNEKLEEELVGAAKKEGMVGLKGHRSVGGIRVSLYNAVELAWARELASFMKQFAQKKA